MGWSTCGRAKAAQSWCCWRAARKTVRRLSAPVRREYADGNRLHTLSPEELYAAHLTPYLQQATEILESRLQSSQQENQALMEKITSQRAEIERFIGGIEGVVRDLEGSVEVMGTDVGGGVEGLRAEVWEMEEEVRVAS